MLGCWWMGYFISLNSESREADSQWPWMRMTSCHTLLLGGCVRTCVGATKCIFNCTERQTLKTLEHMYMHSGTHKHWYTLTLSLLPCVSSFALSRSPFKEGPNFSLISFIKRCGEKRRKRRRREGESKKRLGGQIGERWIGYYTADCTI